MEQDRHIGQRIGNYRLVEQLDCGSFGCVYRAEHLILKTRTVAIKILHAHLATQQKREGFFQEAELLELLKHPHILPILDVGIQDGFPYLVTEYCPEGSLHRRLKRQRPNPLQLEEAITILTQVGQALQYVHEQNVVHRDLKPENILFNSQGEALLADFGIAKMLATIGIRQGTITGTPPYMAPEQFRGTASKEGDQYALGCIAYEFFTGRRPFTAPDMVSMMFKHVTEQPLAPRQLNPRLPVHIEQAILTAIAKEREARHADVATFIAALLHANIRSDNEEYSMGSGELQQVGPYTITQLLAEGLTGRFYLARHQQHKRDLIIKLLRASLTTNEAKEAFLARAGKLKKLKHRNIIEVMDYGFAPDLAGEQNCGYLVMQYAANGSITKRFTIGQRIPADEVKRILSPVADALHYAHVNNVVHGNLLVGERNETLLTDFSCMLQGVLPSFNGETTAFPYKAPEHLRGAATAASDQYALAVMVYEWLCGRRPYEADEPAELLQLQEREPLPAPRSLNPDISPAVEGVLLQALAFNPGERFPHMQAFAEAYLYALIGMIPPISTFGNLKRYQETLAAYEQAIRLDPNDAVAYNNKGNTLYLLLHYQELLAAYEQAIRLDPNDAVAYNNKGLTLYDLKRYQETLVAYEQAIHLDPNFAFAYYNKGLALEALGKNKEAQQAYERARHLGYSS